MALGQYMFVAADKEPMWQSILKINWLLCAWPANECSLISIVCQMKCVESKLVISSRMMNNWNEIYHMVELL